MCESVSLRPALLLELSRIHNGFHVSMLKRCISDPSHVISTKFIDIWPDLIYEEEPIKIFCMGDQRVKE